MHSKSWWLALGLFLLGISTYIFFHSDFYTANQLNYQMNKMVSQKDYQKMKSIASNQNTYSFLKNLSIKNKFQDTTDSQGGSNQDLYYVTVVKNQTLDVYIRKVNAINWQVIYVNKQ